MSRRAILIIIAVVALVVIGDYAVRVRETGALLTAVEASEAAMIQGNANVRRNLDQMEGVPFGQWPPEATARLAAVASDAKVDISVAGAAVEDSFIVPWHGDLIRARERYMDHSDVWVHVMDVGARETMTWGDNLDPGAIESTFTIAHGAFEGALKWPAWPGYSERVEAIFAK